MMNNWFKDDEFKFVSVGMGEIKTTRWSWKHVTETQGTFWARSTF